MSGKPKQLRTNPAALDDVDAFYVRLGRALKAKFDEAPDGVTAAEIWNIVARAGDAPLQHHSEGNSA